MTAVASVSVVIAAHNGERFLADAIDSVLSQTRRPLEVIVVDDGSTDGTGALAASYAERNPSVHVLQRTLGSAGAARNVGWRAARGTYIAILDQDDVAYPGRLEAQVDVLDERPDVAAAGGYCDVIDADGAVQGTVGARWQKDEGDDSVINTTMTVRRKALEDVGGYLEIEGTACEDADLIFRLRERYPLACVREPVGGWRVHGGNSSAKVASMARWSLAVEAAHRRRVAGIADPFDRGARATEPSDDMLRALGIDRAMLAETMLAQHLMWTGLLLTVGDVKGAREHLGAARAAPGRPAFDNAARLWFADARVLHAEGRYGRMLLAGLRSLASSPAVAVAEARHPLIGDAGRQLYGALPGSVREALRPVRDHVVRLLNGPWVGG